MYSAIRKVDATVEPVSLQQAKAHCLVQADDQDSLLLLYISAARRFCEEVTGRAFLTQTWLLSRDSFPAPFSGRCPFGSPEIMLPRPRVQEIVSIEYLDGSGTRQTLPSLNYLLDAGSEPGVLMPAPGRFWPYTPRVSGAVQVTYTAGYGDSPQDVPADLQLAILMLVAHWYENREATVLPEGGTGNVSVPLGVADILAGYTLDLFTLE